MRPTSRRFSPSAAANGRWATERYDRSKNLILLPIKPNGVEHQYFNRHTDRARRWIAFIYMPLQDETGFYLEQQQDAPAFRR